MNSLFLMVAAVLLLGIFLQNGGFLVWGALIAVGLVPLWLRSKNREED